MRTVLLLLAAAGLAAVPAGAPAQVASRTAVSRTAANHPEISSASAGTGTGTGTGTEDAGTGTGSEGASEGTGSRFVLPVAPPPVVLTPFRPPEHRYGSGHRGVDLAAPAGSPVHAAASGTVVFAGMLAGRGVVSIEHPGGLRTTYEPVAASVAAGRRVTAGDAIGTLSPGHPSCAPADCLHWGARLPDGSYLDPMSLLRPWQVRLKPWDAG